jgi:hypothetical protein
MKKLIQSFIVFAVLLVLGSCEKVENKILFEGGKDPVLTSSAATVSLEPGNEAKEALHLSWTNPDYMFTTGVSSHDVTYTIEFDVEGGKFESANKKEIVIAKELSKTFTVAELNAFLGNTMKLQTDPRKTYVLEVRVVASIGAAVKKYSNVMKITTSPFSPPPKVEPPGTLANNYNDGELWIVGDASPNGWNNPLQAQYLASHKFTRKSKTLYELTITLPGGGGYKLIQKDGVWATQYHMTVGTWAGGEFEKKDADPQFPGPSGAGNYKITVDFQLGTYSVVKL